MPQLRIEPLSPTGFADFGDALMDSAAAQVTPINAGTSQRYDGLAELDLNRAGGTPHLSLFRSQGVPTDGTIALSGLERHLLGSQTFVPLRDARIVVVVAQAFAQGVPQDLRAFLIEPGQGVTLRAGVWHHPLLTLGAADVLVIERRAAQVDCEWDALAPGWSLDLAS